MVDILPISPIFLLFRFALGAKHSLQPAKNPEINVFLICPNVPEHCAALEHHTMNKFILEQPIRETRFLCTAWNLEVVIFSGNKYTHDHLHIHKFDIQIWSQQSHEGNHQERYSLVWDTNLEKKQTKLLSDRCSLLSAVSAMRKERNDGIRETVGRLLYLMTHLRSLTIPTDFGLIKSLIPCLLFRQQLLKPVVSIAERNLKSVERSLRCRRKLNCARY